MLVQQQTTWDQHCVILQKDCRRCVDSPGATGATVLTDANFSASDIMSVTGHKSASSLGLTLLTAYQKTSVSRKQQMSEAITSRINPLNKPGPSAPATVTSESLIETQTVAGPLSLPLDLVDVQSTAFDMLSLLLEMTFPQWTTSNWRLCLTSLILPAEVDRLSSTAGLEVSTSMCTSYKFELHH